MDLNDVWSKRITSVGMLKKDDQLLKAWKVQQSKHGFNDDVDTFWSDFKGN